MRGSAEAPTPGRHSGLCGQVMGLGRSARSLGLERARGSVDAREAVRRRAPVHDKCRKIGR